MLGFRVWDVEKKEFFRLEADWKGGRDVLMRYDGSLNLGEEQFIPMQSTGIKDVNGQTIFEGDIVEFEYRNISGNKVKGRSTVGKVPDCIFEFSPSPDVVIVGHIYESPELLEKLK